MHMIRRGAALAAIHGVFAIMTTWPLARHFATHIPLGREDTATVPLFNLWSLEWNLQRIQHFYANYWDAPIFWPTAGTFARSEAQPITGILFSTFRIVVGAAGGYNLVLLTFLTLNGVAGAVLARRLTATWPAAIATGIATQALPFVWSQLGVLQLVCVFPMVFALERLIAYRSTQRLPTLLGASTWCIVCVGTSGYYAIFLTIMLTIAVPVLLWRTVPWRKLARHGLAAAFVVVAVAAPYFWSQQLQLDANDRWSIQTVTGLSAHPGDYIDQYADAATIPILRDDGNGNGIRESPGLYLTAFATIGGLAGWRMGQRRVVAAALGMAVVMFTASIGLHLSLFGGKPYRWLYDYAPGFDRLRSPFRYSVGVQIALIVLVALAATAAPIVLGNRHRPTAVILVYGLALLIVLEGVPFNAPLQRVPATEQLDWVRYLKAAPPAAVAMVPFPASSSAASFESTAVSMLAALHHRNPIVNGYTGLFPRQPNEYDASAKDGGLKIAMDEFPDRCGTEQLQRRGVRYVVVERSWYTQTRALRLLDFGYRIAFNGRNAVVLRDSMKYRFHDECA